MSNVSSENILDTFSNITTWCESYLRDPRDRDKPLKFRSYQKEVTDNSRNNKNIILQWGRRMGKSVVMCADCLWWASVYPMMRMIEEGSTKQKAFKILIFTPYESQIKELWNTFAQLIGDSPLLQSQVEKIRCSDVHLIEFKGQNGIPGSIIQGHTIGISSSNQGTSLRGLSGDYVFIDEMDFIPNDIMEQIIVPITTTHKNVIRRVCSTPSGARDLYFQWCTEAKQLGWFHTHHPSWHPDNDNWSSQEQVIAEGKPIQESTEFQVKSITSSSNYAREYGAEFGEEFGGVYKHILLNKCLVKYGRNIDISDPCIFDPGFPQHPSHKYVIGVDWNSYINGGQIVMMEFCTTPTIVTYFDDYLKQDVSIDFTGKYRLFYRRGIKSKDSTQRQTREEIIRLMRQFKVDFVYVDYGAGDTNIEELTHYGLKFKELGMDRKLKVVDSGAVTDHWDHMIRKVVKKRNKSLMVNFSVVNLEQENYILPKEEDQGTRLVGQMRGYTVKSVTARGDFSYEGEDHILDAFNLAIFGFEQQFGSILKQYTKFSWVATTPSYFENFPSRESNFKNSTTILNSSQQFFRDPEIKRNKTNMPVRVQMPRMGGRTNFNLRSSRGTF